MGLVTSDNLLEPTDEFQEGRGSREVVPIRRLLHFETLLNEKVLGVRLVLFRLIRGCPELESAVCLLRWFVFVPLSVSERRTSLLMLIVRMKERTLGPV